MRTDLPAGEYSSSAIRTERNEAHQRAHPRNPGVLAHSWRLRRRIHGCGHGDCLRHRSGRGSVRAVTTYHLNLVQVPETIIVDKKRGEALSIELARGSGKPAVKWVFCRGRSR